MLIDDGRCCREMLDMLDKCDILWLTFAELKDPPSFLAGKTIISMAMASIAMLNYQRVDVDVDIGVHPKMAQNFWNHKMAYQQCVLLNRIASQSEGSPVVCHLSLCIQGVPPKQPRINDIS